MKPKNQLRASLNKIKLDKIQRERLMTLIGNMCDTGLCKNEAKYYYQMIHDNEFLRRNAGKAGVSPVVDYFQRCQLHKINTKAVNDTDATIKRISKNLYEIAQIMDV
jgi:hypothetical protein